MKMIIKTTFEKIGQRCGVLEKLGEGGNGKAFKVLYDKTVACLKVGKHGKDQLIEFWREANIMTQLDGAGGSPEVLAVATDTPAMVTSFVPYPTLMQVIEDGQVTTQRQLLHIVLSVAKRLGQVHQAGFAHCDLKEDNIMVDMDNVETYLIDFGIATKIGRINRDYVGGTIKSHLRYPWFDPMFWRKGLATAVTDVYSLGYMMKEIIK